MDPNVTREIPPVKTVLYQCLCGEQLILDRAVGGVCSKCDRTVSAKLLEQDLGITITLENDSFQLGNTLPGGFIVNDSKHPQVVITESDDADPDLLVGKMFGHFKIISPLGRGGMGQVYRALDTSLQRYVAVKVLRSGISDSNATTRSSDREVDNLLQEAISQARVTHPNIVTIYYVGKQDGNPFLAMELVNGMTLNERVTDGPMPFEKISPIAIDITQALKFSFDLDIIHGDIKPSNVLVSKDGSAKLSDFGMARSASGDTSNSIGGTPNYIAPELLKGEKPSIQTDIYALGVTFFEMTFGRLPKVITGPTIKDWIDIHETTELVFPTPWPPQLPEEWKKVLLRMLDSNPANRYQNYEDLLADIEAVQPSSKVAARFFPRLIAAGIDWVSVLSTAIVLEVILGLASGQYLMEAHPVVVMLLEICNFLPIIGYTFLVYFWRHSIGRSLMHIRVVNEYGLKPTSSGMMIRSGFRMQFAWVVISLRLFRNVTTTGLAITLALVFIASVMFLLVDILFMVFYKQSRSVHDLVGKTRVVLDTSN
ncbi:MAG: protein kinase [Mariniblastus sp.]